MNIIKLQSLFFEYLMTSIARFELVRINLLMSTIYIKYIKLDVFSSFSARTQHRSGMLGLLRVQAGRIVFCCNTLVSICRWWHKKHAPNWKQPAILSAVFTHHMSCFLFTYLFTISTLIQMQCSRLFRVWTTVFNWFDALMTEYFTMHSC